MNKKSKKWIFPLLIWLIILGIASPHVLTSIKHFTYEKGTAIVELSTYDHIQEETFANRKSNYKIYRTDLVLDINGEKVSCYIYDKKRYDEENSTIAVLNRKKLALKNIQSNKKLTKCNKWIREYQRREKCIEKFQQENANRISKCRDIKNQLQSAINEFANEQLESVGEGLYSIFQKLVKHTNIEKFQYESAKTVSRSAGAVFKDTSGKNIFNI